MKNRILSLILFAGIIVTLISCAHQGTPSGGPDDKTSPKVVNSFPRSESVNVPTNSRIIISFSEWLSTKSDRGVSIFPPAKVKITVNRDRIEIIPVKGLLDSTTYHITINTLLQDLHNNPILSPVSLVFSTGNTLDSGEISGCVIDPSKKVLQPKIALFNNAKFIPDSGLTVTPDYLVQTDSSGRFGFSHVKKGNYRIIGFSDANSDNLLEPVTEQVYSPVDSLITISDETAAIKLFPSSYDTARPKIKSIQVISSTIISGQWMTPYDLRSGLKLPQCTIERTDSLSASVQTNYISLTKTSFFLQLKMPLTKSQYRLIYKIESSFRKSFSDTVTFNGVSSVDTIKPVLNSWLPNSGTVDLLPEIKLMWSKPIVINTPLFLIDSTGNDTVMTKIQSGYSDTVTVIPKRRLKPSSSYNLVLLKTFGNDISGNSLKARDTTDTTTVIRLRTVDTDSLAISMTGGTDCLGSKDAGKWVFKLLKRNTSYISPDSGGQFRFDSIPSGKGLIYYFEDLNGNNKPDTGKVLPWIAPELFLSAPDTIEARARWEVEGIQINNLCAPCKKTEKNIK